MKNFTKITALAILFCIAMQTHPVIDTTLKVIGAGTSAIGFIAGITIMAKEYINDNQKQYTETIWHALMGTVVAEDSSQSSYFLKIKDLLCPKPRGRYVRNKKKSKEIIKDAINNGLDINQECNFGYWSELPLHEAVRHEKNISIIKLLLDNGAKVNLKNAREECLLHKAADIKVVDFLLSKGCDPNLQNARGQTALHYFLTRQSGLVISKLLLAHGARCDIKDRHGDTPLHQILKKKNSPDHLEFIALLLNQKDCDSNSQNMDGQTALHLAIENHQYQLVKLLIDHGANPLIKNKNGKTAFDLSCSTLIQGELRRGLNSKYEVDDTVTHQDITDIKPFASEKAATDAYRQLQEEIKKHGHTSLIVDKMLLFCQRLMRYKVMIDIAKQKTYTQTLGLSINKAGYITMKLLPQTIDRAQTGVNGSKLTEINEQNTLLFMLKIDKNRTTTRNRLYALQQKRVNHAPNKSAKSFFPEIFIDDETVGTNASGIYRTQECVIWVAEWALYTDDWVLTVMHEFLHHLQYITGREMGGSDGAPVKNDDELAESFGEIINEYFAEKGKIKLAPDKEKLLEKLRAEIKPNKYTQKQIVDKLLCGLPYFSQLMNYAVLLHEQKKKNPNTALQEHEKAILTCYEKLWPEINRRIICATKKMEKVDICAENATRCEELAFRQHTKKKDFEKYTNKIKGKLRTYYAKKNKLTYELQKKIDKARNYRYGSKGFLKLKKELGLIPS